MAIRRSGPTKRGAILGVAAAAAFGGVAQAAGVERFTTGAAGSGSVDHSPFDALLARYARDSRDGIVRVDYAAWKASADNRQALRRYLDRLAAIDPLRLSRDEQFAFWANLYNALTLDVVLAAFPVSSIRKIKPTLLALGPWKKVVTRIDGVDLTLDAIETSIMRKAWRDPRVHYAVNCASFSCPNLPLRAWRGGGLSAALDLAARAYINHPRAVRFDGPALVVSSIYKWYAADFGGSDAAIIQHLSRFATPELGARLRAAGRISRDVYDWSLNDTRAAA